MMMQMVEAFAEFERAMIRERTSAGLEAARAEGRVGKRNEARFGQATENCLRLSRGPRVWYRNGKPL
jgi:DNA invertase Pin-like site-specific DNA recombinase